jgi:hypothetical protein
LNAPPGMRPCWNPSLVQRQRWPGPRAA